MADVAPDVAPVWRMSIIVEMRAENIDQAESIGRQVWEQCSPVVKQIPGVKWMLPVGDFKERTSFAA